MPDPAALDPELWSEYLVQRRRDAVRLSIRRREQAALAGVGDVIPEPLEPASEDELLTCARRRVDDRRAFLASPEGRFCTALAEIGSGLDAAAAALEAARAARSRAFAAEARLCRQRADELHALSRRIGAAALDASLAASDVLA
jgi:hypothetical protein